MNPSFIFLLIPSLLFLFGCSSNDSKPKDYWNLNEPQVFAWDTSEEANVKGFSVKVSKFNSDKIKDTLDYQSYVQFKDTTSDINLEIKTSCKQDINNTNTPEDTNQNNNTNISSIESSDQTLSQKFKITKADKLYFYSYLPDQVIYDDVYQSSSPNFKCNFKFTAINKINSKHEFSINDLSINTFRRNVLTINSVETEKKNPTAKTILPNRQNKKLILPSIYYNQKGQTYVIDKDLKKTKLVDPGYIQCIGKNNKLKLATYNNELVSSIGDVLMDQLNDGVTTFLKKCRVITKIKSDDDSLPEDDGNTAGLRTVWSEYFNVIFEEPKISVEVEQINNSGENYPFNKGTYLDHSTHAFDLVFSNDSNKEVLIRLPSKQNIQATLTPLIYNVQRDDFKAVAKWDGLTVLESPEEFLTELRFMSEGERIAEFILKPQSQKIINIEIDKNFNCSFSPVQKAEGDQTSERGFRIKAIDLNSEDNMLTIDYKNQGAMDSYPEFFSFNSLLESAQNKGLKTIINGKKVKRTNTNYLQWNINRTTAIDTIVFRNLKDINTPAVSFSNDLNYGYQLSIAEYMRLQISNAKKKSDFYPSSISPYQPDKTYCTQVY
jgi:hypothetical protein